MKNLASPDDDQQMDKSLRIWILEYAQETLSDLLTWAIKEKKADRMILVFRDSSDGSEYGSEVKSLRKSYAKKFERFVLDECSVRAWPGTELTRGTATILVIKVTHETAEQILELEPDLAKWIHPDLPEDLCVYKEGAEAPLILSVTHESLGWVISDSTPPNENCGDIGRYDEKSREYLIIAKEKYFVMHR